MRDSILFDPAEIRLRSYLAKALDVPVFVETPDELPAEFVELEKYTSRDDLISEEVGITLLCCSDTRVKAAYLTEKVRSALKRLSWLDDRPVYRVDTISAGGYNPDPDTGRPRYQITIIVRVRGRSI
ncbi:hypothetical protein [Leucobacter sp. OH1287]|uniref:hypothetical protein n=1 Tax=Leucobacter sp. OH1287 TaxID=2491049 RepID=UPI000F5ED16E|nr:hypothetical protein [Leucobacter sp. OH1287]RRD61372.1 hypothetical protein EII30_02950 [Leucobacter sp. OH1287]